MKAISLVKYPIRAETPEQEALFKEKIYLANKGKREIVFDYRKEGIKGSLINISCMRRGQDEYIIKTKGYE